MLDALRTSNLEHGTPLVRVGILGGTFDPVHLGHVAIARAAREELELDLVLFVPAGLPWRKTRLITAAEHRLAMLRLAIGGDHGFGISDIELKRPGPTYTADTLDALAGERLDDEFWFIVGADALADLPNWKDPERIVEHAILAVSDREGANIDEAIAAIAAIAPVPALSDRIVRFAMPEIDVSSTEVRSCVRHRQPIDELVPPAVATYITARGLYRR
jgi:nicotinate-nucleotide adenylyltransferase